MAHLVQNMFFNVPVATLDTIVKDPHNLPLYWVGLGEPERVFGDGSPGTKAEFTLHMMGVKLRMVDRTVEERHNPDGSTDWRWDFEGTMSGSLTCHHEPRNNGTATVTTFDYSIPGSLFGRFADRLFIEKRVRHDFEDSLDNLKLLAESSAIATAEQKTA